ncbi:hypothetical protein D3C81_1066070 [compost metagenome]
MRRVLVLKNLDILKLNEAARFQGILKSTKAFGSELIRAKACACSGVIPALDICFLNESMLSPRDLAAFGFRL